jgi:ABC-type oligopeptide transport system ATPase subunit
MVPAQTATFTRPCAPVPNVLEITGLKTHIRLSRSTVHAVDGVSLHIAPGETLGLVGESGCGKTITGMSIIKLLPQGGRIVEGSIVLNGRDVVPLSDKEMRTITGSEVAVVFHVVVHVETGSANERFKPSGHGPRRQPSSSERRHVQSMHSPQRAAGGVVPAHAVRATSRWRCRRAQIDARVRG